MLGRISLVAGGILGFALFIILGRPIYQEFSGGPGSIRGQLQTRGQAVVTELRASIPVQVNDITRLVGAELQDQSLYYYYTLDLGRDEIGEDVVRQSVTSSVDQSICADDELAWLSKRGMTFVYSFIDKDGNLFIEVPVAPGACDGEEETG
ncbi:MAG: hypothetical protein AAF416_02580 [Pseudomonadota bacterium]